MIWVIGDIHGMVYLKATKLQVAAQQIIKYEGSEVANMGIAVYRGSA